MNLSKEQLWQRFQQYYTEFPAIGLAMDLSRVNFPENFFPAMDGRLQKAFRDMAQLEKGAIANPDENRMVGHYWLRNPSLAPTPAIRLEIEQTITAIKSFVARIHNESLRGALGPFRNLLLIGIGGSALGPQFVAHALGHPAQDKLRFFAFDNTDPDGMDQVLAELNPHLGQTLCVVVSKSGGTKETRNGMLEAKAAYEREGLSMGSHAVAITQAGSELDKVACEQKWIARFPMWDWVGGRTSELSAVGLLPAALQGIDIDSILAGAKSCDEITRRGNVTDNPSAMLAAAWYAIGNDKVSKNMVVIPYKDRLQLFSKYLQQLIMESLGKARDLDGNLVEQGICVFGNKGSSDQHSYIQQLRDGLNNFFVTFIEVLVDRVGPSINVEPNITAGDFLTGFLLGTRQALFDNGRESLTLTVRDVSPFSVGVLIALFERAVGLYASLININPYHQPGVEAGKKAASTVIAIELKIFDYFSHHPDMALTAQQLANDIGEPAQVETVFRLCQHLAANPSRGISVHPGDKPFAALFRKT